MNDVFIPEVIREESFDPNADAQIVFRNGRFHYDPNAPAIGSSQAILHASRVGFACTADPTGLPSIDQLYGPGRVFENAALRDCHVLIVGLGSVGSVVAIQLSREGILYFTLADFDRVELHNLSRHVAGIKDLTRLKTDIVEEHILQKNPYAQVTKLPIDIMQERDRLEEAIAQANLVICATDNVPSRYVVASLADKHDKTVIYGWAETRAEGVDVFIQRPGEACYGCLAASGMIVEEEITNEASARRSGVIPAYTSPADAEAIVQVGLPSDIDPLVNLMVKLGLTELARGKADSGIENLGEELRTSNYFTWANRRTGRYRCFNPFNEPEDGPTILRWYGCTFPRIPQCGLCAHEQ